MQLKNLGQKSAPNCGTVQAQEVEETDEMLAAVDEGIRSIEEQGGTPAEEFES
jgi:hypothetical protein